MSLQVSLKFPQAQQVGATNVTLPLQRQHRGWEWHDSTRGTLVPGGVWQGTIKGRMATSHPSCHVCPCHGTQGPSHQDTFQNSVIQRKGPQSTFERTSRSLSGFSGSDCIYLIVWKNSTDMISAALLHDVGWLKDRHDTRHFSQANYFQGTWYMRLPNSTWCPWTRCKARF